MKKIILMIILSFNVFSYDVQEHVNEIDQRVSDLELLNVLKKFVIDGSFINHWETYSERQDYRTNTPKGESIYVFSTIFELDFNAILTNNLSFYSRLGMSKFWNHENNPNGFRHSQADDTWNVSNQGSFGYWGSTPKFDRAYLSYNFLNSTANFSIGRMSTHNGPPIHQEFGERRAGTYPRLAYNAIFDGIALSYNFSKYLSSKNNLEIRAFYTPFVNIAETSRTDRRVVKDSNNKDYTAKSLTDQYNLQIEYSREFEKLFKMNMIFFYYQYTDFFQYIKDDDVYNLSAKAQSYYLGFEKILNTGLNLSISHLRVHEDREIVGAKRKLDLKSHGLLLGGNYRFSNNWILGAEYIKTSEYYYIDEWTYYTISDFYRVPNNEGEHVFVSFPIFDLTKLKVGAFYYQTPGSDSLDADGTQKKVRSVYATLKTNF